MGSESARASTGQSANTFTKLIGIGSKIQNVITSATVEYSKPKQEINFDDEFDHEDAWGDVKRAKDNIGKYEQSITDGIKQNEEKPFDNFVVSPVNRSSPKQFKQSSPKQYKPTTNTTRYNDSYGANF